MGFFKNELMARVGVLRKFEKETEMWPNYVEKFECFCTANGVQADVNIATFLASIGVSTYAIAYSLVPPGI